jgi:hypothetical protein
MIYSRDLFISYGADTVLILNGDTLAATSGIISSVLSDGVTITGNGTTGSELTVDTLTVIATKGDLTDYVTIAGTETITGAKTFTSALTQSGGDVNFDSGTLFVDESADRVGIGTSSPEANLDILAPITSVTNYQFRIRDVGSNGFFSITEGSSGGNVYLPNFRGFGDGIDDYGIIITGGPNSAHDIGTAGRAAFIFEAAEYDDATNTVSAVNNTHLFNFTNFGSSKMFIENSGDVGIGTTSPSHPLEMGSGAHVTTGGVWTDASDIKLKTNINYIYPYGLEDIMNLKPTMFDYKNGEKNSLGFIAQDIYEIIPEAISSTIDDNGNETMGVKMVSITATLTKAIQEQQAIIETQASEIETLKTLITDLSNRLQILENN